MSRAAVVIVIGCLLFAIVAAQPIKIVIKGSDTLVKLGQEWARVYMAEHKNVLIHVSGGGSGRGVTALLAGETDICEASRDMTDEEYAEAERSGVSPVRIPVALDGIVVFVHQSNPVNRLSFDQLQKIFTGEIINWKDVGGKFDRIALYGRQSVSGTYAYFKHQVLRQSDYAASLQALPGTAAVVEAVAKDTHGIGYGGITWVSDVKYIAVSRSDSTAPILPVPETIADGSYPISRPLYWFFNNTPTGELKQFVNWALGKDGQRIAERLHYVPLPDSTARANMIP